MNNTLKWLIGISGFLLAATTSGLYDALKVSTLARVASLETVSTGLSSVALSDSRVGEFLEHRLGNGRYSNMLYQGFVAVHLGIDSILVRNTAYGRSVSARRPGDSTDFGQGTRSHFEDDESVVSIQTFQDGLQASRFRIVQTTTANKDSGNNIEIRYVVEMYRNGDDSVFNDVRFLFGYDADIGSTTGGYTNDSCRLVTTTDGTMAYVFDDSLGLFTGLKIARSSATSHFINAVDWHRTVNSNGKTAWHADSLALSIMTSTVFDTTRLKSDVSLFATMDLGTVVVQDTVRDTLDLVLINGRSLSELVSGMKAVEPRGEYPAIVDSEPDISLMPGYPNPFNPTATIPVELYRGQFFELRVFNILGQHVKKLHTGFLPAGRYKFMWDGTNDRGESAASGIYLVSIRGKQFTGTSKMTLVR